MNKLSKLVLIPFFALSMTQCNHNSVKESIEINRPDYSILWSPNQFSLNCSKNLYEALLPDSLLNKQQHYEAGPHQREADFEHEMFDLQKKMRKYKNEFYKTSNREDALMAMAYAQYLGTKYGSKLDYASGHIKEITDMLEKQIIH